MKQHELQHLYLRSGFGESLVKVLDYMPFTRAKIIDQVFEDSRLSSFLHAVPPGLDYKPNKKIISVDERKEIRKLQNEYNHNLNLNWVQQMCTSKEMLMEKMTFLWHGHFACRVDHPLYAQKLNNTIRKGALGKFSDLLFDISKEAAMLQFLNNRQNKKASPNENFAREVMELFTLGRGNYTETDVRETARAFTGWNFDDEGNYVFNEKVHDRGVKDVFGKRGNYTGDDILLMILDRRECASYIAGKFYTWFVNDEPNHDIIAELAKDFYESDYNIQNLLRKIFEADWFYNEENIGVKIKSPVELIVGTARILQMEYINPYPLINVQRVLGQFLFNPPNVAGWKGGKDWIDSSTILFRLNFVDKIVNAADIHITAKPDDDMMETRDRTELERIKNLSVSVDWNKMLELFDGKPVEQIKNEIRRFLIQTTDVPEIDDISSSGGNMGFSESDLKEYCLKVMSLPEFQMV